MKSPTDKSDAASDAPAHETTPVTIGTAGHIDHGKTLLVEKLTGMRADRPYERERGMTIDIGYAEFRADGQRVGFVDLPGHERFIRNMVAGASGIDLALLVVAADDGVMPQTREHVEILELLGVRRGIAVLNKVDIVDDEMRELALDELREFLAGTSLAGMPVFPCSAATGEGVDALREALLDLVAGVAATEDPGAFFMAVQRTFAAAGFGCIATGVPAAGRVSTGDELELLPSGKKARVRAIEIYHEAAEHARAGHRTALNLAGVHHEETARGMVVATPGMFPPSRHVIGRLRLLSDARRPLKHAGAVRFLTGTLEEMASVFLFSGDALKPGEDALVEIRLRDPAAIRDGAPFIVRSDNAKETLGGGMIVCNHSEAVGRRATNLHQRFAEWETVLSDPAARLQTAVRWLGASAPANLAGFCQLDKDATLRIVERLCADGALERLPGGAIVAGGTVTRAAEALRAALTAMHKEQPLVASLPAAAVRDRAEIKELVLGAAIERLGDDVVLDGRSLRLAGHSVDIDPALQSAADQVLRCLDDGGFAPPQESKLADASGLERGQLQRALTFLRDQGRVRLVANGLLYRSDRLDEGLRILSRVAAKRGEFEPVDAKAALGGISRKWLIPLLEFYDRIGATRRDGNARRFTRKGETMAETGIRGT